jgi:hypothetical protein
MPNEFGLERPSADGRPAPTGRYLLRRRRPTPGVPAPWKADFNRRRGLRPMVGLCAELIRPPEAFGRRSACADREVSFASAEADARRASALEGRFQSAQGPSADGRPAPTEESLFASAKADARRASALEADFNRRRAFGRWSACADRKTFPASAKADARRASALEADFNRREGLRKPRMLRQGGFRSILEDKPCIAHRLGNAPSARRLFHRKVCPRETTPIGGGGFRTSGGR